MRFTMETYKPKPLDLNLVHTVSHRKISDGWTHSVHGLTDKQGIVRQYLLCRRAITTTSKVFTVNFNTPTTYHTVFVYVKRPLSCIFHFYHLGI